MKRSDAPLEKVTLNLFAGDMERLKDAAPRIGASFVIRNLVRQFLRSVEDKVHPSNIIEPISVNIDLSKGE